MQVSPLSRLSMLVAVAGLLAALVVPEADASGIFWKRVPPEGRTFVVYAFVEGNHAYIGRASKPGKYNFESVMSRRYSSGIRPGWSSRSKMLWYKHVSGNVLVGGSAYEEARRKEQHYMDQYRSRGYTLGNKRRAIAEPKPKPTPKSTPTPKSKLEPKLKPKPIPGRVRGGGQRLCPPISLPRLPTC